MKDSAQPIRRTIDPLGVLTGAAVAAFVVAAGSMIGAQALKAADVSEFLGFIGELVVGFDLVALMALPLIAVVFSGPGAALYLWLGLKIGGRIGWTASGSIQGDARSGLVGGLLQTVLILMPLWLADVTECGGDDSGAVKDLAGQELCTSGQSLLGKLLAAIIIIGIIHAALFGMNFGFLAAVAGADASRPVMASLFIFPLGGVIGGIVHAYIRRRTTRTSVQDE